MQLEEMRTNINIYDDIDTNIQLARIESRDLEFEEWRKLTMNIEI
jgi:hypothetical protein